MRPEKSSHLFNKQQNYQNSTYLVMRWECFSCEVIFIKLILNILYNPLLTPKQVLSNRLVENYYNNNNYKML